MPRRARQIKQQPHRGLSVTLALMIGPNHQPPQEQRLRVILRIAICMRPHIDHLTKPDALFPSPNHIGRGASFIMHLRQRILVWGDEAILLGRYFQLIQRVYVIAGDRLKSNSHKTIISAKGLPAMMKFEPHTFGDLNVHDYDETQNPATTGATVDFISALAGQGRILELASGTGRITVPLAQRGHDVSGIEGSDKMVDVMRAKPGGADIPVIIGDMADVAIDGTFDHVFLVFNTLFNLTTQQAQVRLFANVAKRLNAGGTFLIEAFVPDFTNYTDHQHTRSRFITMNSVWIDTVQHDSVAQRLDFQRVRIKDDTMQLVPLVLRYSYPPELDLMAQMAGLRLKDRWGGWDKRAFDNDSKMHVSVWEKT